MRRFSALACKILLTVLCLAAGSGLSRAEVAEPPKTILWLGWGDMAFEKARSEKKLIFLDIYATWCHWCKVMDETTYKDDRVVELINDGFVPVRVDTDKRPDINARYNQGGWPSVSVLMSDGRIVSGGTYATADDLLVMLNLAVYTCKTGCELPQKKKEALPARPAGSRAPLNADMPVRALEELISRVDPKSGGYGGPDKFPTPDLLEFALYNYPRYLSDEKKSPERAIRLTLDGMQGGLLDSVEGGFFRYSTSPDWKAPHYEKMLATNGDLLGVYMQAYQLMGTDAYKKAGESVAAYLDATLYDSETGAFFNSQAADEEYYKTRVDNPAGRPEKPPVDRTVYADSNAAAVIGYLSAYRATGEERYLGKATGTLDFIMSGLYVKGRGVAHSKAGELGVLYLADQVYPAIAAERAYQATGDYRYLAFAVELAGVMDKRFGDEKGGGYYDVYYDKAQPGLLADRRKPQTTNSKAALLFIDLFHLTGEKGYKAAAKKTLTLFAGDFAEHVLGSSSFALGAQQCMDTTYEFLVVGKAGEKGVADLIKKAFTYADPDRVVVALDPERDKARLEELGYGYEGAPVMYVCSERSCFPPVNPADSLSRTKDYIEKARAQERR